MTHGDAAIRFFPIRLGFCRETRALFSGRGPRNRRIDIRRRRLEARAEFRRRWWVSVIERARLGVRDVPAHAVPPGRQDRRGHRRHKRPRVRSRGRSFGAESLGRSPYTLRGRVASRRRATLVGHVSFVVASPVPTPTPSLTPSAPSSGDRLLPRRTAARSSSRWLATARACTRARGRARTSTRRWLLGVPRAWP